MFVNGVEHILEKKELNTWFSYQSNPTQFLVDFLATCFTLIRKEMTYGDSMISKYTLKMYVKKQIIYHG